MEVGRGRLYIYPYTVTTRTTSALGLAVMRAVLMFHNCEGQSQDSVHRPKLLKRKESRGPSSYQPNALLLVQTGSQDDLEKWEAFITTQVHF